MQETHAHSQTHPTDVEPRTHRDTHTQGQGHTHARAHTPHAHTHTHTWYSHTPKEKSKNTWDVHRAITPLAAIAQEGWKLEENMETGNGKANQEISLSSIKAGCYPEAPMNPWEQDTRQSTRSNGGF